MFTSLNGHHLSEYLLVLEPNEALQQKVLQLKQHFATTYDCPTAVYSKPHIILLSCSQYTMAESRWLPRLERIIAETDPFMVELSDFGSFPTHTIFIRVKTKNPIIDLVKSLRPLQPHLTIARKLLPWQYEKGWLEYSNSQFTGRFMADHVLLMRKQGDAKKYEIVKRFQLLGQKQIIEQSSLFDW